MIPINSEAGFLKIQFFRVSVSWPGAKRTKWFLIKVILYKASSLFYTNPKSFRWYVCRIHRIEVLLLHLSVFVIFIKFYNNLKFAKLRKLPIRKFLNTNMCFQVTLRITLIYPIRIFVIEVKAKTANIIFMQAYKNLK